METDKKSSANVLKSYLRYLKLERNYSQNTLDAYSHDITWLMDYCKREGLEMTALQLEDLQHFAATLHEFQIGPRSQSRILSGIRSFYRFLLLDGYIETDPTELLESPALGQHLPEVLSTAEVDMLEQSIDLSKPEGQRNRAII
ncbi:MAG: site-specific integrase, partial [Segatella sp.]